MSSISTSSSGLRRILFRVPGRPRQQLRLGKVDMKTAREVRHHVDEIINAEAMGRPVARETVLWIGKIGHELHSRLSSVGLTKARVSASAVTLKAFCQGFIDRRTDWKQGTRLKHEQCLAQLCSQFNPAGDIRTFTEADAKDFRRKQAAKYSEATVATRIACAKRFFADAVDRRIIDRNPFAKVKGGSFKSPNASYVDAENVRMVMEHADPELRAVIALSRFAGLRVPSELPGLRWSMIDESKNRMKVLSPKTERQGKPFRYIPLWPEFYEHLKALPRSGEDRIFTRSWSGQTNLRTALSKAIARSDAQPWKRLWHNMRASWETDLVNRGELEHKVFYWLGNSKRIAQSHYLRVTDEDFARASGADCGALQRTKQNCGAVLMTYDETENAERPEKPGVPMVEAGIEGHRKKQRNRGERKTSGAESGARLQRRPLGAADYRRLARLDRLMGPRPVLKEYADRASKAVSR